MANMSCSVQSPQLPNVFAIVDAVKMSVCLSELGLESLCSKPGLLVRFDNGHVGFQPDEV